MGECQIPKFCSFSISFLEKRRYKDVESDEDLEIVSRKGNTNWNFLLFDKCENVCACMSAL